MSHLKQLINRYSDSLITRVLSELPPCQIFSKEMIRETLIKHCGSRAKEIGKLLFPAHLLKLGDTDQFIHRANEKRPVGYRGLIDHNGDGVIFAEPLPEPFCDDAETTTPTAITKENEDELVSRVLKQLIENWDRKKIPVKALRQTIKEVLGIENTNRIEWLLIDKYLVKTEKDKFLLKNRNPKPPIHRDPIANPTLF